MITNQEMVVRLGRANAIMHLANGSLGPGIIHPLVKSGEIVKISQELIRPYYQQRVKQAIQWVKSAFGKTPCLIHKPEGAISSGSGSLICRSPVRNSINASRQEVFWSLPVNTSSPALINPGATAMSVSGSPTPRMRPVSKRE